MSWTLTSAREFTGHAASWRALNRDLGGSPALDADFVAPLLTAFGTGKEILAVRRRRGGTCAMALLTRPRPFTWETFQPSQAPVGLWLSDPGDSLESHLESLSSKLPGFPLVLGIMQLDPDLFPRPPDSPVLNTIDYIRTARLDLRGEFDEYWSQRGKNLRHNVRRQLNRLGREAIPARLEVITDENLVGEAIDGYARLESAGWKSGEGTAVRSDNEQGLFYRQMLEAFARRGSGRIYRYWLNDELAATDLCIEQAGTLIILKTTYDERVKGFSPAFLMRFETFRQLFADRGIKRIEFYGRLMEWHTRWTEEAKVLYHANYYSSALTARLHRFAFSAMSRLRRPRILE